MIWCCLSAASSWLRWRGQLSDIALTVAVSRRHAAQLRFAQLLSKPNTCRYRAGRQADALSADKRTHKGQVVQGAGLSGREDWLNWRQTLPATCRVARQTNNRKLLLQLATTSDELLRQRTRPPCRLSVRYDRQLKLKAYRLRIASHSRPVCLSLRFLDLAAFSDAITPD